MQLLRARREKGTDRLRSFSVKLLPEPSRTEQIKSASCKERME